jgi:hypothetical protein
MLSVVGGCAAAFGLVLVGFAFPAGGFTGGAALLSAGTTALVGGLILIGLGAVAVELRRMTDALAARPVRRVIPSVDLAEALQEPREPREPKPAVVAAGEASPIPFPMRPRREAKSEEVRPVEERPSAPVIAPAGRPASVAPAERLRASLSSLTREDVEAATAPAAATEAGAPVAVPMQAAAPEPDSDAAGKPAAVAATNGSMPASEMKLDAPLLTDEPLAPPRRNIFDSVWPPEPQPAKTLPPAVATPAQAEPSAAPAATAEKAAASDEQPAAMEPLAVAKPVPDAEAAAILKSGVIEGMAYTLYADGSIEAQLTNGTIRFGSINELRAHLEKKSA